MTTFAILKTDIKDWLERTDLDGVTPTFVLLAEASIARDVRVRDMLTEADLTITAGSASLPTGYIEARRLFIDNNTTWKLDYMAPDAFWDDRIRVESGVAIAYTVEGDTIHFRPTDTTTGKLLYYKRYTALSADADTNWLLANHYDVYLYGSLLHTAAYIGDDQRISIWGAGYERAINALNKDQNRMGGSTMMTKGTIPV